MNGDSGGKPAQPRLLESLKALGTTAVAAVETRLRILSTDLEEERDALLRLIFWGAVFLFSLFLGVVLAAMLVVVVFWESQRFIVLAVLTGIALGVAAAVGLGLVTWWRRRPSAFATTLEELAKDRERLGRRS
jgi:uncharacterized membrane protein YqjE